MNLRDALIAAGVPEGSHGHQMGVDRILGSFEDFQEMVRPFGPKPHFFVDRLGSDPKAAPDYSLWAVCEKVAVHTRWRESFESDPADCRVYRKADLRGLRITVTGGDLKELRDETAIKAKFVIEGDEQEITAHGVKNCRNLLTTVAELMR